MTKIKVSDGKEKPVRKITVTEAPSVHSTMQKSTTLSRRYVKKPEVIKKNTEIKKAETKKPIEVKKAAKKIILVRKATDSQKITEARKAAEAKRVAETRKAAEAKKAARLARIEAAKAAKRAVRLAKKNARTNRPAEATPSKNDRAIRSATAVISKMAKEPEQNNTPKMEKQFKKKSKAGRVFLALLCSAGTVAALVAFVHFSVPDLSVRVAAIQTGIDAAYPTFIPRGYNLGDVTSDKEGVVIMTFRNSEGASFTLSEEKSTWDSTALLNNYVKKNYPNDFTTLREQGITIYVRGEKASWVNGGLLYKIDASGKYLTKEQIRNIATSL